MLNWMNVSFNVLINSKDELKLENLIYDFVSELNKSMDDKNIVIGGVSSVKFESNYMDDSKFEKILEKGMEEIENK